MDFTAFDSRTVADEGRPLHLRHPATGELLWDDGGPADPENPDEGRSRPCIVYVLGTEGRIAQEAFREAAKLPKLGEDATQEDYHERLCVTARKLIVGFENVDRGDRPATAADTDWFLGLNISNPLRGKGRSFAEQVLAFAGDRGPIWESPRPACPGRAPDRLAKCPAGRLGKDARPRPDRLRGGTAPLR
ncbi:hypothetical protein ACFSS8_05955 [Paracoccus kondratievae]